MSNLIIIGAGPGGYKTACTPHRTGSKSRSSSSNTSEAPV